MCRRSIKCQLREKTILTLSQSRTSQEVAKCLIFQKASLGWAGQYHRLGISRYACCPLMSSLWLMPSRQPLWAWLHSAALGVTCLDKEGFLWCIRMVLSWWAQWTPWSLITATPHASWTYTLCSAAVPTNTSLCLYEIDILYIQSGFFICCDMEKAQ